MWDCNKRSNACAIRVPARLRENGAEKVSEKITAKNFPNLAENIDPYIQKAEPTPNSINPKKSIPRYTIVTCLNTKEKILKVAGEK